MSKRRNGRTAQGKFHQPAYLQNLPGKFKNRREMKMPVNIIPRVFKSLQPNFAPDKIFIVDTSVLLHDPESIEYLASQNNLVIIMTCVIQELDHFKNHQNDPLGFAARETTRKMEHYQVSGNCLRGVKTKRGGYLVFVDADINDYEGADPILVEYAESDVLKQIKARSIVLVSKDTNLRVKARAKGIIAEDYNTDKVRIDPKEFFPSFMEFEVAIEAGNFKEVSCGDEKQFKLIVDNDLLVKHIDTSSLEANQCCKIKLRGADNILYTIFKKELGGFSLFSKKSYKGFRIKPRNDEQIFALALLFDPTIEMVALPGKAGTGKTLLSLLAGFEQLQTHYDRIIVYRPVVSVGQDLGYLPGDEREKFAPWKLPITDNFNLILGSKSDGEKIKKEKGGSCEDFEHYKQLEILPYAYIRGRSIPNIFMIVDESQNIPPKDMKTITSRAGQNTKVVVIGDPDQIDHQYLDSRSNGLCKLIQKMRGQEVFGVITLQRSERSRLSDLVASLL